MNDTYTFSGEITQDEVLDICYDAIMYCSKHCYYEVSNEFYKFPCHIRQVLNDDPTYIYTSSAFNEYANIDPRHSWDLCKIYCKVRNYEKLFLEIDDLPEYVKNVFNDNLALVDDFMESGLSMNEWIDKHRGLFYSKKFGI